MRLDKEGNVSSHDGEEVLYRVTTRQNTFLQPDKFGPRTWRHDLRVFHFRPDWKSTITFYKETVQGLALPTILWLLLLNGAFLGVYVYQASTFATVLMAPPFLFHIEWLGYVQLVQILDCLILVPVLGYGSDLMCKAISRWRGGIHEVRAVFRICLRGWPFH